MITGVRAEHIPKLWAQVMPLIKRVTDRFDAGYDETLVYERLLSGDHQLWIIFDDDLKGVFVTEVQIHPFFKILSVPIVAGDEMDTWLDDLVSTTVEFGRHHDCKYIEGYGRKGWVRRLSDYGFKDYSVTVRREL